MGPAATRGGRRNAGGYTLIEVIVAFALLAMALTLLLGTLSGAARQVRWSADAGRAALHAQSLLDSLGVAQPLQPGTRSGAFEDGRYPWSLTIAPWTDPARVAAPAPVGVNRLYELTLTVRWGDGRGERLQMQSLRLVQPDLAGGRIP